MANIGTLSVALTATADKFLSAFGKAQQKVEGFVRGIPGMNMLLSKTGAILGALAGGALVAYGRSVANRIDETAKLADRIGTTTESLVGLQHAAELAGGGTELLEQGLQKLSIGLGKATEDAGTAKEGLAAIGLQVDDLLGKDPAEQFRMIAEGISHLATQEEKAAAAANIFGKAGAELVNVLELGREGLDAMQKDAEQLGITFSRVDAYKVEAANDALTRVSALLRGAMQRAVIELAPYIEAAANALVDWATSGEGAGKKVVDAVRGVAKAVAITVGVLQGLWGISTIATGAMVMGFSMTASAVGWVIKSLEKTLELLTLGFVSSDFGDKVIEWAQGVGKLGKEWVDSGVENVKEGWGGERIRKVEEFFDEIQAGAQKAAEGLKAASDAKKKLGAELASEQAAGGKGPTKKEEKDAETAAKRLEREREAMEEKAAQAERVAQLSEEDKKWQSEILEIEEARAKGWEDLAGRLEQVLEIKKKEKAEDEAHDKAAEIAKQNENLRAQVEQRLRIQEMSKEDRTYADEILAAEDARKRGLGDIAANLEKIVSLKRQEAEADKKKAEVAAAEEKSRQEMERRVETQQELLTLLDREIELLSAANDLERERIRIRHELEDRLKVAGDNIDAQNRAQEAADKKTAAANQEAAEKTDKKSRRRGRGRGRGGDDDEGGGGSPSWRGFGGTQFGTMLSRGGRGSGRGRQGKDFSELGFGGFGTAATVVKEERLFGPDGPTRSQYEAKKKKEAAKAAALAKGPKGPDGRIMQFGGGTGEIAIGSPDGPATAAVEGSTGVPSGGSSGAAAASEKLPDPTPKIDEAAKQLGEIRETWGKVVTSIDGMGTKVTELAGDVKSGFDKTAETEKKVGDAVADVREAQQRLQDALETVQQAISGS